MSVLNKIIKNLAIAFGIFLAITIINFCLDGAYVLLQSANLINNKSFEISEHDFEKYSSYLDINLKSGSLIIKNGDKFGYETSINDLKVTQDNDKLIIKDNRKNVFNNKNNVVTIYIPNDLIFEKVNIEMGAGKLDINHVELNNVTLNLGIGKTNINSTLLGKNTIECGIGKVDLNLDLSADQYAFKLNKGIGEIKLNGKKVKNDTTIGNGENSLNIDGGIGKISIKTKDYEKR